MVQKFQSWAYIWRKPPQCSLALFAIAKTGKQPKCPSTEERRCLLFSKKTSIRQPPTHCEVDESWNALQTQGRIQFKTQPSSRIPISMHCHQILLVIQYMNVLQVHTIYNQSSNYSRKYYTGKILMAGYVYFPMCYIHKLSTSIYQK